MMAGPLDVVDPRPRTGDPAIEPDAIGAADAVRPLVLSLDIGSSSVRGAVHDTLGRTVAGTTVQLPFSWDVSDGGVRLPHERLLELVGEALDAIGARAGSLTPDVLAGGISCFLHSFVGLDAAGTPVTPVLSWADTSSAMEASALRDRLDPTAVHQTSGAPLHAGYWPARIQRLRREHSAIVRWSGFPELLAGWLTGRVVVSRSMASGTGLLDRRRGVWSTTLLTALGVDADTLPEVVDDLEPIGRASSAATERWPRLAHLDWFPAWGDSGCSNVGLAATRPATAALMLATSGALRAMVDDPAPPLPTGLFAQRLGDGSVVGGQLSEGGGLLASASRWLGRSPASLELAAADLDPDAHGLTVLPFVFGERGLGYHDEARGALLGIRPDTDAVAIYRAIVESIAFSFAAVDDALRDVVGGPPAIHASGGALAHSPTLAQALADSLGREIRVASAVETSRRGAALLALQGIGAVEDLASVPPPPMQTLRHDPARTARYRAARERRDVAYRAILG